MIDEEAKACTVIVPDGQLSLAIGNKGQNAKLAAKLTGYKIDIKPVSEAAKAAEEAKNEELDLAEDTAAEEETILDLPELDSEAETSEE